MAVTDYPHCTLHPCSNGRVLSKHIDKIPDGSDGLDNDMLDETSAWIEMSTTSTPSEQVVESDTDWVQRGATYRREV